MPKKPKKPCRWLGCSHLTDRIYCLEHQQEDYVRYNKYERDPQSDKRYGRAWKRICDRYIKMHPLCEECRKNSLLTPAKEVHHILPISKGGSNETDNLMALCKSCHSHITAESGNRWNNK